MLYQQTFWDAGHFAVVIQIGLRNHLIKVFQSGPVQHQKDHVISFLDVGATEAVIDRFNVINGLCAAGTQLRNELVHNPGDDHCIVRSPVMIEFWQIQPI